ncbi:hypothetical protein F383_29991 [Gossypium arboreum]|uniref:Uncharacterized protein n=1 Tax=Gossypium arboreum TaxID=29729 RepID=A0A0B0PJL9_GOSAR|nr:hypothetical protein F383_29991 [Gossypium arboreum]
MILANVMACNRQRLVLLFGHVSWLISATWS